MLGVLVSFVFTLALKKHWTASYKEMAERSMDGLTGALPRALKRTACDWR